MMVKLYLASALTSGIVTLLCIAAMSAVYHPRETGEDRKCQGPHTFTRADRSTARQRPVTICAFQRHVVARARFAFASLVSVTQELPTATIDEYVEGVIRAGASIAETWRGNEPVDMILLAAVDDGLTDAPVWRHRIRLHRVGWQICPVPTLAQKWEPVDTTNLFHRAKLYSKISAWRLKEYDAVAMIDADTLALGDTSRLFSSVLPAMQKAGYRFAAAADRPIAADLEHRHIKSQNWPWCRLTAPGFNAGVILLVPDYKVYRDLLHGIDAIPHKREWCEQGLLNAYFAKDTYPLPEEYNVNLVLRECSSPGYSLERAKILHFTVVKPWSSAAFFLCWFANAQRECSLWQNQCTSWV